MHQFHAQPKQLTLLGGGTGMEVEGHDWNFILEHMGWLTYDIRLARAVLMGGRIVMVVALAVAVWFAVHTIFARTAWVGWGAFGFDAPVLASIDIWSLALAVGAAVAIFRFHVGMIQTLAGCCAAGVALFLAGAL